MEKIFILWIAPAILVSIVLGWLWLLAKRQKFVNLKIGGFGLTIELSSTAHPRRRVSDEHNHE